MEHCRYSESLCFCPVCVTVHLKKNVGTVCLYCEYIHTVCVFILGVSVLCLSRYCVGRYCVSVCRYCVCVSAHPSAAVVPVFPLRLHA